MAVTILSTLLAISSALLLFVAGVAFIKRDDSTECCQCYNDESDKADKDAHYMVDWYDRRIAFHVAGLSESAERIEFMTTVFGHRGVDVYLIRILPIVEQIEKQKTEKQAL